MARVIRKGESILDYLETLMVYNEVVNPNELNKQIYAVSLNKGEWVHFVTMYLGNVEDCSVNIDMDTEQAVTARYKGIIVNYNGDEETHLGYLDDLYHMYDVLARRRQQNLNPEQEVEEPAEAPRRRAGAGTVRATTRMPPPTAYAVQGVQNDTAPQWGMLNTTTVTNTR